MQLTDLERILAASTSILLIERISHFIRFRNPIKKVNEVKMQHKEVIMTNMGLSKTLKERDSHIQNLENEIKDLKDREERFKRIIPTESLGVTGKELQ